MFDRPFCEMLPGCCWESETCSAVSHGRRAFAGWGDDFLSHLDFGNVATTHYGSVIEGAQCAWWNSFGSVSCERNTSYGRRHFYRNAG
jgi:hypothetical protein